MDIGAFYGFSYAILMLVVVFVVGYVVARAPLIRRFYLPTALVAGLILLALGSQVLGRFLPEFQLSSGFYNIWRGAPKILINVVFACLFLAHPLVPAKKIWKIAGPQVAFGQMMAWGQYFFAGLVTLFILMPIFQMPDLTAAILEISFEGGHGTVAGLSQVFSKFNFESGRDIANGLATASLITSLLAGIALINWGKRRGHLRPGGLVKIARNKVYYHKIIYDLHAKGIRLREHLTIGRLSFHLMLVVSSVAFGFLLHGFLAQVESLTWGRVGVKIMSFMPYFTFCMIGGVLVGEFFRRIGFVISREIIQLINAVMLSGLIMTAIGTMSLDFLVDKPMVFVILYLTGALWLIFSFLVMARRMFSEYWFANAIISFGQSMGMTATGLLFAQMVDPKNRTNAVESFGYKQLMFEPLMGGGIITTLSIPIIAWLGLPIFTAICGAIAGSWMIFGMIKFRRRRRWKI